MAANNPNNVNAKTVQGPDPTGNQGYPIATVPAIGADPTPISGTITLGPGAEVVVTDIEDGAGDSIMEPATNSARVLVINIQDGAGDSIMDASINAARTRPILPIVLATAQGTLGLARWIDDESGVRLTLQTVQYISNSFTSGSATLGLPEGHAVSTLLSSAARTTSQTTSLQQSVERKGCRVYLNVTVASGTGGLTVIVEARDPVTLNFQPILTAAAPVIATGLYTYFVYPAAAAGSGDTLSINSHIGTNYRIRVAVGDASSYTYSLGLDKIK